MKTGISEVERACLAGLAGVVGFGAREIGICLREFGSAEGVFGADELGVVRLGLSRGKTERLMEAIKRDPVVTYQGLVDVGIRAVSVLDGDYPEKLKRIEHPPYVLFVRGQIQSGPILAVVGTRRPSNYGQLMTERLVVDIARAGVVIVSGLALGVDALAHKAAVEAQGKTMAVLANGVDEIYPTTNHHLGLAVVEHGALISEYPSGTPSLKQHFVARNRIVSGMSDALLVVEGNSKSGTLITARFAKEQERELMAVPGETTNPLAAAPNSLIQAGARPVFEAGDVLEFFGESLPKKEVVIKDPVARQIFELVEAGEGLVMDELVLSCELERGAVVAALTGLELGGLVVLRGGRFYVV